MANINQEHELICIAMHRILTRLLECYITNILVINECGIQINSGSSYMRVRGFEHANLTTTHMDSVRS